MSADGLLTICTVSYESAAWLELNHELGTRLNPGRELRWVVAENSPVDSKARLASDDERFEVIPGAPYRRMSYSSESYHHGAGLNLTLPRVATRYLLVLDPDFFIVRPGWMDHVVEHMQKEGVAVFGTPWHPSRTRKVRYFPCPHCMFVDLEKVPRDRLDFLPDGENAPSPPKSAFDRIDPLRLRKRRAVGTSRDTGWRLYRDFGASDLRVECLQAVYRPSALSVWWEKLAPEAKTLIPRRPDYFTSRGFREHGWPDLETWGCEEFVWRGEPFGFHVRTYPKREEPGGLEAHRERVRDLLAERA